MIGPARGVGRDVRQAALAAALGAGALVVGFAGAALALRRGALRRHGALLDRRADLDAEGVVRGGGPLVLPAAGADLWAPGERHPVGALVLHGFGDTTQSVAPLARHLHALGYAVRAPLLPGHGRTLRAFTTATAESWIAHARAELGLLRRSCERVVLAGQSMGGALAVLLAAERSPDAVVLLAPYLTMPARLRHLARAQRVWAPVVPLVASGGEASIHDTAERAASLSLGVVSGPVLAELARVVDRAAVALPKVRAPVLVVQSRRDHRIAPEACERAVARLGSPRKRLVWTDEGGHVLSVDRGRERLFALVAAWLADELAPRPRRRVREVAGDAAAGMI